MMIYVDQMYKINLYIQTVKCIMIAWLLHRLRQLNFHETWYKQDSLWATKPGSF